MKNLVLLLCLVALLPSCKTTITPSGGREVTLRMPPDPLRDLLHDALFGKPATHIVGLGLPLPPKGFAYSSRMIAAPEGVAYELRGSDTSVTVFDEGTYLKFQTRCKEFGWKIKEYPPRALKKA
jgi:hypothetical protein